MRRFLEKISGSPGSPRSRTSRARPVAPLAAALLAAPLACSHGQQAAKANAENEGMEPTVEVKGDTVIRTYDLNKDGKPDDWKHFRLVPQPDGQAKELMTERELDTNFDGKVDSTTWFDDDGQRTKEVCDLDFDGKPDVINDYEHGVIVRKELFETHREKPDATVYFEGGKKVRVERDTHGNGKIDTWEYYEGGKLSRIGEDVDGDGLVDRWIKAKSDEDDDSGSAAKSDAKPADKAGEKPAEKPAAKGKSDAAKG